MKYQDICKGKFIERPNRFIARIDIDGKEETAHVKNTGRCRELLIPGAFIWLEDFKERMGSRKMRYSLITVKKGELLINMDSQVPNKVVKEALENGNLTLPGMKPPLIVRGESTFGNSRLDFYLEDADGKKGYMEVKGVTLEESGVAKFPDAPTERGVKHLEELVAAVEQGYAAYAMFVIAMKGVNYFRPHDEMHLAFGDALRRAEKEGVTVLAYDCVVTADSIELDQPVPVKLFSI